MAERPLRGVNDISRNPRNGIQQGTRIMTRTFRRLGLTATFALLPATAFAHAQGDHGYSLLHGLA